MSQPTQKAKYRPYFTASELSEVIRCVKLSSQNLHLLRYLESYALKISHGVITESITLQPTLADSLELDSPSPDSSLESKRAKAYAKWLSSPQTCTPIEIELTHLYRFENDLMSQEEETIYLQSQGAT
jgi:hypothetical protein